MSRAVPSGPSEADLVWCRESMTAVSRTFAITVDRLEEPMASHVCVGYLCCRVADTVEDAGHIPLEQRAAILAQFDRVLDPADEFDAAAFLESADPWIPADGDDEWSPDWNVVAETPRVVETFECFEAEPKACMRPPIRELVTGMATFADRHAADGGLRIRSLEELESYCWYVAGTVGTLVTDLVARDASDEQARLLASNARSFALLLQLVNVSKDVARDYRLQNDVYLPASWLADVGVDQEAITEPAHDEAVSRVIGRLVDHAAGYLDDAQRYLEVLPEHHGNRLSAWAIPYLLAVGTIRELRRRPADVLRDGDVKISRAEVATLIGRFEEGVDRDELATLRAEMADRPLHQ